MGTGTSLLKRRETGDGEKKINAGGRREEEAQEKAAPSSIMSTRQGFPLKPSHFSFPPSRVGAAFIFLFPFPPVGACLSPEYEGVQFRVLPVRCCIIDHFDLHLAVPH